MHNKEKEYKIYKITEPDDMQVKHVYIGFTIQTLNQRLNEHICHSKRKNFYVSNWINKLIKNGKLPKISLIKITDLENWEKDEIAEIEKARQEELTTGIKVLNIAKGGSCPQLGKILSEETKKKISESKKNKCTWTEESTRKLKLTHELYGNSNIGRKASNEEKLKLSIAHKGNKSALGHKLTLESKQKIAKNKSKFSIEILSNIKKMLEEKVSEKKIIEILNVTRWAVYSVKHKKRLINP